MLQLVANHHHQNGIFFSACQHSGDLGLFGKCFADNNLCPLQNVLSTTNSALKTAYRASVARCCHYMYLLQADVAGSPRACICTCACTYTTCCTCSCTCSCTRCNLMWLDHSVLVFVCTCACTYTICCTCPCTSTFTRCKLMWLDHSG